MSKGIVTLATKLPVLVTPTRSMTFIEYNPDTHHSAIPFIDQEPLLFVRFQQSDKPAQYKSVIVTLLRAAGTMHKVEWGIGGLATNQLLDVKILEGYGAKIE